MDAERPEAPSPAGAPPSARPDGEVSPPAALQDVVSGLLASIVRGQAQADVAMVDLATANQKHPQLAFLPVSRAQMVQVDLDLNVALLPATRTLTVFGRSRLFQLLLRESLEFCDKPPLAKVVEVYPTLAPDWYHGLADVNDRVASLLDSTDADAERIAYEFLVLASRVLFTAVFHDAAIPHSFRTQLPQLLDDLLDARLPVLAANVATVVHDARATVRPVRVLYSVDQLQNLPPQTISRMHVRIEPQNRRVIYVDGQPRVTPE